MDVHPAEARRIDPAAVRLRTDVAHEMGSRRGVAVDVAIETRHAELAVGPVGLAVGRGVELLLRELCDQEAQPLQVLGVEDAGKDLLEVRHGHQLPL